MGWNRWSDAYEGHPDDDVHEQEWVDVHDVAVVRETERALLVSVGKGANEREMWIPKSQISEDSPVKGGIDCGVLVITKWIADQKDLA